ncbi:hypothetical protein Hanom_Chr16g01419901 [Helianthus anomalus]
MVIHHQTKLKNDVCFELISFSMVTRKDYNCLVRHPPNFSFTHYILNNQFNSLTKNSGSGDGGSRGVVEWGDEVLVRWVFLSDP